MDTHVDTSDELHPTVYVGLIGIALLFAAAVWSFAVDRYIDYLLIVVTGFALVAIAIPTVLSRVGRHSPFFKDRTSSFRDWARGDFETDRGRVQGVCAAIEILLPLSAATIGMLAIGIVMHLTISGGA